MKKKRTIILVNEHSGKNPNIVLSCQSQVQGKSALILLVLRERIPLQFQNDLGNYFVSNKSFT
jgi:hypothetical protein